MSLDVWLEVDTGGDPATAEVWSRNTTHNLIPMADAAGCYMACWRPDECGVRTGADVLPVLEAALAWLGAHEAQARTLEASNGWGTVEHFRAFLADYAAAAHVASRPHRGQPMICTAYEVDLLNLIASSPDGVLRQSMGKTAAALGCASKTVSRMVAQLVADGVIERDGGQGAVPALRRTSDISPGESFLSGSDIDGAEYNRPPRSKARQHRDQCAVMVYRRGRTGHHLYAAGRALVEGS